MLEDGKDFNVDDGGSIKISAESFARINAAHASGRAVQLVVRGATAVAIEAPPAGKRPGMLPAYVANG